MYQGTPRNLAFLARRLRAGEIVAVPTETVYGLAGNALDADACAKIFQAKGRPAHDPLIVHIHSATQLELVCEPNGAALKLAKSYWPGPLTLILPKKPSVPDVVTAGRDSVAVRMPSHPLFRRVLKLAAVPLAAPSANPFGYISPTTAEHVRQSLGARIRYILDGGAARIGLESTIVDLRNPKRPAILRPGVITAEDLERTLGRSLLVRRSTRAKSPKPGLVAPGLLTRHYSPRTPVVLHAAISAAKTAQTPSSEALVFLRRPRGAAGSNVFWLDARGGLRGVARQLFAMLRKLDMMKFTRLHVELAHGGGLAPAINDRLRRAAAR
jgi:L-threonylcarbamoyladenylate synthase